LQEQDAPVSTAAVNDKDMQLVGEEHLVQDVDILSEPNSIPTLKKEYDEFVT
jgi:hypothetical protein